MPSYHITEPHPNPSPSVQSVYYGRGGAGNRTRINPSTLTPGATASGPASRIQLTPPPSNALFTSGRGGAGNVHREKERAMFSFDEELAQQERMREHAAPVYHIGRGGAGNLFADGREGLRRVERSNSNSSSQSSESESGVRRSIEGAWNRVSRQFTR